MLADAYVYPTIPAANLDRSRKFYQDELGLKVSRDDLPGGGFVCDAGHGTALTVYFTEQNAGKAPNTLASFRVDDIEATVKGLKDKGVFFEEYDQPPLVTKDSIADLGGAKAAWLKDPDGNIIGIVQM